MRLQTEALHVAFNEEDKRWTLQLRKNGHTATEVFDKLVLATGINKLPLMPRIDGLDAFEGEVVHSAGYKRLDERRATSVITKSLPEFANECLCRPEPFKDKTILVVGLSNSAADTATTLVGHAKQLPRFMEGTPMDHVFTHRKGVVLETIQAFAPWLANKMMRNFLTASTRKAFPELPQDWDLSTAPLPTRAPPIISEHLIPEILAGNITLVKGLKRVVGRTTIQLEDGQELEVDAILFCTGYKADFSLAGPYDPTLEQPQGWVDSVGSNSRALPKLYRNIFSLQLPHHLAFIGTIAFASPAFLVYDLASMALARIWSGQHSLPGMDEMTAQVERQHQWLTSLAAEGTVIPAWVQGAEWMAWADKAAGPGVLTRIGYGFSAWMLWMKDRQLSKVLLDGIPSPHQFRLFENGQTRIWSGARDEILRINSATSDQ
ncbi:hypothetical protein QQS21_001846 [Conoideocrella luteorostrata]|uniref:Uncharacterized protein n=1 Tax=Conoideocrella luteorostrata TaxID=1105319 RepID=A0AAJ0CWC8_9HYPO|nr:hypothetical protein QQS21_001846 [Conoideocrella luteorostrata]